MDSLLPDICTVLIQGDVKESLVVTYATTSSGTGNCIDNIVTWKTELKQKLESVDKAI